jgi:hypothetical protein
MDEWMYVVCMYVCMHVCVTSKRSFSQFGLGWPEVSLLGYSLAGWPDWANFLLLGGCFLSPFFKYKSHKNLRATFPTVEVIPILILAILGHILGEFF